MDDIVEALSELEKQTIFECLCAAEREELFPEWEFETLFGITRKQLSSVREKWPEVDARHPDIGAALIGAMSHLLGYARVSDGSWGRYISVPPDAVESTLKKLLSLGV